MITIEVFCGYVYATNKKFRHDGIPLSNFIGRSFNFATIEYNKLIVDGEVFCDVKEIQKAYMKARRYR